MEIKCYLLKIRRKKARFSESSDFYCKLIILARNY
jgi:hypothetical protein